MRGAFIKVYTVFAVLFFVGLIVYFVIGLNAARDRNEESAERQLQSLTNQIERSSAAAGSYSPQTVQMVVRNFASSSLQAFSSYAPDGKTDYLFSRSSRYLQNEPGSSSGAPRFQRNPVTEARLVRSIALPGGDTRLGEAVYTALTRADLYRLLRQTLLAVVAFALLTTIVTIASIFLGRSASRPRRPGYADAGTYAPDSAAAEQPIQTDTRDDNHVRGMSQVVATADTIVPAAESESAAAEQHPQEPQQDTHPREGLFSKQTGLSYEEHLSTRLALELERSAYNDQDLAVILIRFPHISSEDDSYQRAARSLIRSFGFEDLSFEFGGDGFCVILPNTDLNQGIRAAEEFRGKVRKSLPDLPQPLFGVTARSGRLVEAHRVLTEARNALERSVNEPGRIVGFRPDPQKYRDYLADQDEQ